MDDRNLVLRKVVLCALLMVTLPSAAQAYPGTVEHVSPCDHMKLAAHFEGERVTLLAVLSPRMVYALKEWPRMQVVAEQAGYSVRVKRDPRVPKAEWQDAAESQGLRAIKDIEAMDEQLAAMCGLLNHAPSVLIGRCGIVHPWPILGVMPDAQWSAVLRSRASALDNQACVP